MISCIKHDVAHRLQDARIMPERKSTEIMSSKSIKIKILIAVLDKLVSILMLECGSNL